MSIADAVVTWKFNLPIHGILPQTNLFQGADLARDPVTGIDYLFQGQAHAVGPGDVEDWSVHRYRMDGPDNPVYVDSMRITGAGHIQAHFVRITAASNPYVMIGMEIYDEAGKQVRKEVRRCLYRAGTFDKNHANFKKVFTGPGLSTDVVGNDKDFTIVLRRGRTGTDEFEWYDEGALLAHASDTKYPVPDKELIVPKHSTTAQTWTSIGAHDSGTPRAFRFNGLASDNPQLVFEFRGDPAGPIITSDDVTEYRAPGVSATAFNEPEMLFIYQGRLYMGKQFNGASTRILAFFSMSWTNP